MSGGFPKSPYFLRMVQSSEPKTGEAEVNKARARLVSDPPGHPGYGRRERDWDRVTGKTSKPK